MGPEEEVEGRLTHLMGEAKKGVATRLQGLVADSQGWRSDSQGSAAERSQLESLLQTGWDFPQTDL